MVDGRKALKVPMFEAPPSVDSEPKPLDEGSLTDNDGRGRWHEDTECVSIFDELGYATVVINDHEQPGLANVPRRGASKLRSGKAYVSQMNIPQLDGPFANFSRGFAAANPLESRGTSSSSTRPGCCWGVGECNRRCHEQPCAKPKAKAMVLQRRDNAVTEEEAEWDQRQQKSGTVGRLVEYYVGDSPEQDITLRAGGRQHIVVANVREGGVAASKGVRAGDRLVSIGGKKDFMGLAAGEVQRRIMPPVVLVFLGFVGKLQAEVRLTNSNHECGISLRDEICSGSTDAPVVLCEQRTFNPGFASLFLTFSEPPHNLRGVRGIRKPLLELHRIDAHHIVKRALNQSQAQEGESAPVLQVPPQVPHGYLVRDPTVPTPSGVANVVAPSGREPCETSAPPSNIGDHRARAWLLHGASPDGQEESSEADEVVPSMTQIRTRLRSWDDRNSEALTDLYVLQQTV